MRNKRLCSLLLATAMLSGVTAFTSCEALDDVLRFGEDVFDNAMGAVGGVMDPLLGELKDLFGGKHPDVGGNDNSSSGNEDGGGQTQKVTVKSIALDATNAKTEYNYAEEFTTEGLKVTATMSDGTTKSVDSKDCRIVKPDMTKPGTRTVMVVYEGQTARYDIHVKTKEIPQISSTSLLNITAKNESVPYRVEAETIDMVTPGVKKADGITDFVANAAVDADITSGDKYLTGFNVQYNYFGFTFTANEKYDNTTIVLRVANSTGADLDAGEMKMYLNFEQDENGNASGEISLDGYTIEANGAGKWTDIVLRGIDIPAGTNTLTFEVQNDKAFDLDYIDFYVGMRYINSIVEISDTTTIVKDLEDFDTEKAFTRADVAAAHGLKDGQLFVESVKDSPGKTTSKGTAVGAIGKGSQLSTTIRLGQNATVRIKMKAGKTGAGAYYVDENWRFFIDGVELKMVEHLNIEGGNSSEGLWWDWIYTNVGEYNLSAGDHLFLVEVNGSDCNVDTFEFEVVSLGEYDESGTNLDNQHACESKCPVCGKCLNDDCTESACEEKCQGHEAAETADLTIDGQVGSTAIIKAPNFNWANCEIVTRADFIPAVGEGNCGKGTDSIYGFADGSIFRVKLNVQAACTLNIYLEGFGGAAFSNYSWKFGGTVITPTEGAQLPGASPAGKVLVGTVNVSEAGVYTFEFTFGVNSDLYNVHFEAVEGATDPDVPSVDPEQPEVTPDITITDEATSYKAEAEELDLSTLTPQTGFTEPKVESFTGGKGLGGIAGGYQTFTVKSDKDVTVALKIAFAKYEGGSILSFISGVSVNGEALTLTDGTVAPGTAENQWWNVSNVQVATIELKANTVYTFKINVNCGNLDGYVLDVVTD